VTLRSQEERRKRKEREQPYTLSLSDGQDKPPATEKEVKDLADGVVAIALGENPKASFSLKAKTGIQEAHRRPSADRR
jgi:hypothetical protein